MTYVIHVAAHISLSIMYSLFEVVNIFAKKQVSFFVLVLQPIKV